MIGAQKSESRVAARQFADDSNDRSGGIVATDAPEVHKVQSILYAQLALTGRAVHETAAGGFLVVGAGTTQHCPDLHALGWFARHVGARS